VVPATKALPDESTANPLAESIRLENSKVEPSAETSLTNPEPISA
jgi:hypothetical protein